MLKEKYQRLKNHVEMHPIFYTAAATTAVCVVAGITWHIVRSNAARGAASEGTARGAISNTASSFSFGTKQSVNITTVLEREGRGHPGWPVRNRETGRTFFSQKDAAEYFDIPENVLSGHLHGKFEDVDGLHFDRAVLVPA
jgi:hypothetical protein